VVRNFNKVFRFHSVFFYLEQIFLTTAVVLMAAMLKIRVLPHWLARGQEGRGLLNERTLLISSMEQDPSHLVKKFPVLYGS
jgi:hypothetical protein